MQLSALALGTYQICPLRFRFRYLDNLYWSKAFGTAPAERNSIERGQNFHLMARRYYAGLDPAQMADPVERSQLQAWMQLLEGFQPRSFDRQFYPELELRLNRIDLRLQSKFDLLVVDPDGKAILFDWKTEKRLPRRHYLLNSPQTLLYRFMLCTAGGAYSPRGRFHPSEVAMIYWNPSFPHRWERLDYSEVQYRTDEKQIQNLVTTILKTPRDQFVAKANERTCHGCEYRPICPSRWAAAAELEEE